MRIISSSLSCEALRVKLVSCRLGGAGRMVSMAARGLGPMLEAVGVRPSFWSEEGEGEESLFVGWGGIWGMLLSAVGFSEGRGCDGDVSS